MNDKILHIPSLDVFNNDVEMLFSFLERRGYPKWSFGKNLDLSDRSIDSLKNLISVKGYLDVSYCDNLISLDPLENVGSTLDLTYCQKLKSLGNLKYVGNNLILDDCKKLISLGNLEHVGGDLFLRYCNNLISLGNLEYIGGDLTIMASEILDIYRDQDIKNRIKVKGQIIKRR